MMACSFLCIRELKGFHRSFGVLPSLGGEARLSHAKYRRL